MSRTTVASEVGTRTTGFVAKHPRLVVTMVLLVLLIAAQGTVAAGTELGDGTLAGTSGSGSVDTGP